MSKNKVLDGIFGLCVGDALGVPVEFKSRNYLEKNPVADMIGYGTYNQPPGTWSDDSSLTFCLLESLCNGYNLNNIAQLFCNWLYRAYWTPYNEVFDVGRTTRMALEKIRNGESPNNSGEYGEYNNGNGSLMRILPIAFLLKNKPDDYKISIINEVSAITHSHEISLIACGIYIEYALNLLNGFDKMESYENMIQFVKNNYYTDIKYRIWLDKFDRILSSDISQLTEKDINSSGYVIDSLEASLWSFINSKDYKESVLKAVNLGEDTDTIGAITGGISGIYYGFENIPIEWVNKIARKDDIIQLCERFNDTLR